MSYIGSALEMARMLVLDMVFFRLLEDSEDDIHPCSIVHHAENDINSGFSDDARSAATRSCHSRRTCLEIAK